MKQHPIPQNILDVEFKLFTRFTVREFAYLAIGVGFGGIFLFLFSKQIIPGIVAIPIFIVSSSIGGGLALLPINDQNADVYLRNYILAITRPTLRVWRNENFDQKFQWLAQQRGVNVTQGGTNRTINLEQMGNKKVVGGTAKAVPSSNKFIDDATLNSLDREEEERLRQIDTIAQAALNTPTSNQTSTPQQPASNKEAALIPATSEGSYTISSTNETPSMQPQQTEAQQPQLQHLPVIEQAQRKEETTPQISDRITISSRNASQYATQVQDFTPKAGGIALYISNQEAGVGQALIMVKNSKGAIVQAMQSDPQGLVLPKKLLPSDDYTVNIQHDNYKFPTLNYIVGKDPLPVINVKSIN